MWSHFRSKMIPIWSQTQRNKTQQHAKNQVTTIKKGFSPPLKRRGESGIRTLEPVAGLTVFKTVAFDRSANSPQILLATYALRFRRFGPLITASACRRGPIVAVELRC